MTGNGVRQPPPGVDAKGWQEMFVCPKTFTNVCLILTGKFLQEIASIVTQFTQRHCDHSKVVTNYLRQPVASVLAATAL